MQKTKKVLLTMAITIMLFSCDIFKDDEIIYGTVTEEIFNKVSEILSEVNPVSDTALLVYQTALSQLETDFEDKGEPTSDSGLGDGYEYSMLMNSSTNFSNSATFDGTFTNETFSNSENIKLLYSGSGSLALSEVLDFTIIDDRYTNGSYTKSTTFIYDLKINNGEYSTFSGTLVMSYSIDAITYQDYIDANGSDDGFDIGMVFNGTITIDGIHYRVSDMNEWLLTEYEN